MMNDTAINDITPFDSKHQLDLALANAIKDIIQTAIMQKGQAVLAFSGGKTPMGLFSLLSEFDIDWNKVIITLVDDRWVTNDNEASNAGMIQRFFISKVNGARFIPLVVNAESISAFDAETAINSRLENELPVLDLAVLGMGEDGHTASFFPGSPELDSALNIESTSVALATTPTNAAHDRITLSLAFLLKSKALVLHLTGEKKLSVLKEALASQNDKHLPVSFVLHQSTPPLTIYYAD